MFVVLPDLKAKEVEDGLELHQACCRAGCFCGSSAGCPCWAVLYFHLFAASVSHHTDHVTAWDFSSAEVNQDFGAWSIGSAWEVHGRSWGC